MSVSQLAVVSTQPESPAARARRLMAEAREAADEQVKTLEEALQTVMHLSDEIASGGDVYAPGVREVCRRLIEESGWVSYTLDTLTHQNLARRR